MIIKSQSPRWRRRSEDRPTEIVAAAVQAFAAKGFAATRLDDVAAGAGVSKGTLYRYFSSKEELFKAVVREFLVPRIEQAEAIAAATDAPTTDLLQGVLTRMIEIAGSPAGAIPKMVIAEAGNFPDLARFYAEEVVARFIRLLAGLLARGAARGDLRPVDAAALAPVLVAPVLLMALWKNAIEPHAPFDIDVAAFTEAFCTLLRRGLAPAGEEG
ncbi:MAG: TetR/AcrR family transcriptional regulator [Alphaproteobacteria bacterium]